MGREGVRTAREVKAWARDEPTKLEDPEMLRPPFLNKRFPLQHKIEKAWSLSLFSPKQYALAPKMRSVYTKMSHTTTHLGCDRKYRILYVMNKQYMRLISRLKCYSGKRILWTVLVLPPVNGAVRCAILYTL